MHLISLYIEFPLIMGNTKYIVNVFTNVIIDYSLPQPEYTLSERTKEINGQWTDAKTSSNKSENSKDSCSKHKLTG